MTEEQNKYKFDNLQPIAFLRKFNKMADEDQKQPLKTFKKQLKVFPLTKFPLPSFYEKMQGIFETGTKKKDIMNLNLKSKDDIVDQQFMTRHRQFMTKAIQKIIKENQNQQVSLQNYKSQYENNGKSEKKAKKSQSEPKLVPNKKLRSTSGRNDSTKQYTTVQKPLNIYKQEIPEQSKVTYLQKVQIQRLQSLRNIKKEKIRLKQDSKITSFLDSKQNFMTQRLERGKLSQLSEIPTARSIEYNDLKVQDWKKVFIQELLSLQKQQSDYQIKYCEEVEGQIKRFNEKVKTSIQKTKKQKFW